MIEFQHGLAIITIGGARLTATLEQARALRRALNRAYQELRPGKDWDNCPYEGHADDCTCNGMGGDR